MTTAEANNERMTLQEFGEAIDVACVDATQAGIPGESVARTLVTAGILGALEAGVPREGLFDVRRWVEHCVAQALEALDKAAENEGSCAT